MFSSPQDFKYIDDRYKEVVDLDGESMSEISRRYWDDPDYAEELRQKIALMKSRQGKF